ncbi:MAG: SIR2 family NAD-dependent protein deacylase [Oligosphaeraceae bacterium]
MAKGDVRGARLEALRGLVRGAQRIAVLSGAGMSTESGIPDFRSPTGVYSTLCSEEVFDIAAFRRDPSRFYRVMAPLYAAMAEARPNAGHEALARLETLLDKEVCVATQNIDGLHQAAGSRNVQELHGGLSTMTCQRCGRRLPASDFRKSLLAGTVPRHPGCGGVMKPDIVFFGESLPEAALDAAMAAFMGAELALVLGTGLAVYPAAMLPQRRQWGCALAIVNLTETPLDDQAEVVIHARTGEVLPLLV